MSGCSGWNAVNPICRAGQLLGTAAKSVGNDVFGSIADYFAAAASSAVTWLWKQLNAATSIDLTSTSIKTDLLATGAIAALITFGLFLIQVITAVLRQDPGGLMRGVRGLGIAFIGAAFAIASTQVLLAAVDGLCNAVVRFALNTDLAGMGSKMIVATSLGSIGNPAGLLLLSLVIIAAVVVVWVALMIRKMLIIISAVFAPLAFSGAASDVSKPWVRRWIEFTLALVFSKLILVIIFMIGLSVLNGSGQPTGGGGGTTGDARVTSLVIGVLTLLLAGFAPWIAIKMVHFAGDELHAVHNQASTSTQGGRIVIGAPQKVAAAQSQTTTALKTTSGQRATGGAHTTSVTKNGSSSGGGSNGANGVLATVGSGPANNGRATGSAAPDSARTTDRGPRKQDT